VTGFSFLAAPLLGGVLGPSPDIVSFGLTSDATGGLQLSTTWPPGVPPATSLWLQMWIDAAAGPARLGGQQHRVGNHRPVARTIQPELSFPRPPVVLKRRTRSMGAFHDLTVLCGLAPIFPPELRQFSTQE
jgi:hypothetical protein